MNYVADKQPTFLRSIIPSRIVTDVAESALPRIKIDEKVTPVYEKYRIAKEHRQDLFRNQNAQEPVSPLAQKALNEEKTMFMLFESTFRNNSEHLSEEATMFYSNVIETAESEEPFFTTTSTSGASATGGTFTDNLGEPIDDMEAEQQKRTDALFALGKLQERLAHLLKLVATLTEAYKGENDQSGVKIDLDILLAEIDSIIGQFQDIAIYTSNSEADAKKWAEDNFGMDSSRTVRKNDDGTWSVFLDLEPVRQMEQLLIEMRDIQDIDGYLIPAQHSAMQTALDAQQKAFEAMVSKASQLTAHGQDAVFDAYKLITTLLNNIIEILRNIMAKL